MIHSMQGWTVTATHGVTRKRSRKRLKHLGNLFIKDLKPFRLWDQKKAFYRQRIPESSCVRKETVDIDILVTSRNDGRKIMQSIRVTSRPLSRKRKWNQLSQNIYQSNTYRRDLSWPHFNDEPRFQEKQQVKGQQSCIFIFVVCLTIPSSN